ncbi:MULTISPECIES: hypothetical protein [unclassified Streptomyces]|uniref:hypothetical protein n=1 Tax=unclassified Streptomyces TaxID=2593676 RepID=UPI001BE6EB33|nr:MULTISPECIES: hypothetical protein [unclassified Streptomyces]MBT2407860.1 hypothetical protein [Streptomyces sp. ISL-21]MBT2608450.1 hypothetical protein [Streptomyces sp. ISL-87]
MQYDDDEPIFKRSKWSRRYYYNPANPVGRALIVISLLFAGTILLLMANRAGPFKPEPTPEPWNPPAYDYSWPSPSTTPASP